MSDQAVPVISHNPALLPTLPYAFHAPMAFEGPHKFDASHFVGAFQKPDGGMPMVSPMDQNIVPQQPGIPHRLNSIEKQELELARRRAEKAAEGKRANAAAARARRRATRPRLDERTGDAEAEGDASHGEEDDLEAKLAATKDEKEAKRLRRLLRNRVSAQQARERKKSYVSNLEAQAKQSEQLIAKLQQEVKTLERENVMLRQVIRNMQGGGGKAPEAT
ncbi:g9101 [Coccomyxa elongata]